MVSPEVDARQRKAVDEKTGKQRKRRKAPFVADNETSPALDERDGSHGVFVSNSSDIIPSPINLFTPSPANFGSGISKIRSPISIGRRILEMPRSKFAGLMRRLFLSMV